MTSALVHGLRVSQVLTAGVQASRAVESPTTGVVIVNLVVQYEGPRSAAPQHWRVGTWRKPPIDFRLNEETGALESIQVVLQDEAVVQHDQFGILRNVATGWPQLQIAHYEPMPRYVDVRAEVDLTLSPKKWMQASWAERDGTWDCISVPGGLDLISAAGVVVGIEFGPLADSELDMLRASQELPADHLGSGKDRGRGATGS